MNEFQYTFYHITHEKIENEFESIFKEFKNQINIYHRQFNLTLKSYKKEWDEELKLNDENYKEQKTNADKIYNDAIEEFGNDEYADSYASNKSGVHIIAEHYHSTKENINNEYENFLDLYSKSILTALYSLNESKLKEVTELASNSFNKKIKPSHFNSRDYLNSSLTYLNLVIEINTDNIEKLTSKLKDLQYLRNTIIHNASFFSDIQAVSNIIKKYKGVLSLDKNNGFLKVISSDFIKQLFNLLKDLYEELFWLIDIKQDSSILNNGLKHWLGAIDNKISIESIKFEKFTNKEKIISFQAKPKDENIEQFGCKITLKKSLKNKFDFTNQTDNSKINEFLKYEKKLDGNYMMDIFRPFDINTNSFEKKIMVY